MMNAPIAPKRTTQKIASYLACCISLSSTIFYVSFPFPQPHKMFSLLLLLLILFAKATNKTEDVVFSMGWPTNTVDVTAKLSLEWGREYCATSHCHVEPRALLTIHGLWEANLRFAEGYECAPFDATSLEPIENEMKEWWPSYTESDMAFWEHEWYKHGCHIMNSTFKYFHKALQLYAQFNVSLTPGQVSPTSYFVGALQTRYRGIRPRVVCQQQEAYLYEIEICLHPKTLVPVDCAVGSNSCNEIKIR